MHRSVIKYILLLFACYIIGEVSGNNNCGNGYYCDYDQYCCGELECCYQTTYSYWNLWYFWFIVIFVLMTCFGGCGYYRRRQVYLQTATGQRIPVGQTTYLTSGVQPVAAPVYPYHTNPVPQTGSFPSPPPYNEVTSKPSMYPYPADTAYPPQAHYYQSQFSQNTTNAQTSPNQPPPPEYVPPQTTQTTNTLQ